MMRPIPVWATFTAALSTGLMAGGIFSFSTLVMKGLAAIPPPQAIAAMQAIHVAATTPLFVAVFLGSTLLCALLTVYSIAQKAHGAAGWLLAAGVVYLLGAFITTATVNVPLNHVLAAVDPGSVAGAGLWQEYLRRWVQWNHVRGIASLAAMSLYLLGLMRLAC